MSGNRFEYKMYQTEDCRKKIIYKKNVQKAQV